MERCPCCTKYIVWRLPRQGWACWYCAEGNATLWRCRKCRRSNEKEDKRRPLAIGIRNFAYAFSGRCAVALVIRMLHHVKSGRWSSLLDLRSLFDEKNLIVRVAAVRLGLFFGLYGGSMNAGPVGTPCQAALTGGVAGLSVLCLSEDLKRELAVNVAARAAQTVYGWLKAGGWVKPEWEWEHSDTLLFSVCSGYVMYSATIHPWTLPLSYYKFIGRTGPVPMVVRDAIESVCSVPQRRVDTSTLTTFVSRNLAPGSTMPPIEAFPASVPCEVMHSHQASCTLHVAGTLIQACRRVVLPYFTSWALPAVLFSREKLWADPARMSLRIILNTLRSTTFLASFVALYQAVVCTHRASGMPDHRFLYLLAGTLSSLSVLAEAKSRRGELALYVLPRAVESFGKIAFEALHLNALLPLSYLVLFMVGSSVLSVGYHHAPRRMARGLHGTLRLVLGHKARSAVEDVREEVNESGEKGES